jgi:hypothetical protein
VNLDFLNGGTTRSGHLPPRTVLVHVLREFKLEDDFTRLKATCYIKDIDLVTNSDMTKKDGTRKRPSYPVAMIPLSDLVRKVSRLFFFFFFLESVLFS